MPGWRKDGEFYTSNGNGHGRIVPWTPPEIEAGVEPGPTGSGVEPPGPASVPAKGTPDPGRREFLRREIHEFIKDRPEDIARVIQKWLHEDDKD